MKYLYLIIFSLLLTSCTSNYAIQGNPSLVNNKTEYTFPYSADVLASKLEYVFSIENQKTNKIPLSKSSHNGTFLAKVTKLDEKNFQLDITNLSINFWLSDAYIVNGENARTRGKFQVLLNEKKRGATTVSVRVTSLRVINGVDCCGPHGRYSRYTEVKPTTIEEYAFLFFIGEQLDITMPPIIRENKS